MLSVFWPDFVGTLAPVVRMLAPFLSGFWPYSVGILAPFCRDSGFILSGFWRRFVGILAPFCQPYFVGILASTLSEFSTHFVGILLHVVRILFCFAEKSRNPDKMGPESRQC